MAYNNTNPQGYNLGEPHTGVGAPDDQGEKGRCG